MLDEIGDGGLGFYRKRGKVLERTKKKEERIGSSTPFDHSALVPESCGTF